MSTYIDNTFLNSLFERGFREFKPSKPGEYRCFILYGNNNKDSIIISANNSMVQISVQKSSKYNCLLIQNHSDNFGYGDNLFKFSIKQIDFLLRNLF